MRINFRTHTGQAIAKLIQINALQDIAASNHAVAENQVRAMTPYQCCFFMTKVRQPSFKVLHAETDAEARRLVSIILRDSAQIERVEVWRDGDFAFRVNQHQVHLEMYHLGSA